LIYTSGTTGPPKAVQLSHGNVMFAMRAYQAMLPRAAGGSAISYLPTAHIGDRVGIHYMASIGIGATITSLADYRQVGAALPAVRPTIFGGVPRVWEKIKGAIEAAGLREPAKLPDAMKSAVRARMGLDQVDHCLSGAAPASPEVLRFFADRPTG
jgi:long-subunit acyl-CoA synthetase (AMP-forming)